METAEASGLLVQATWCSQLRLMPRGEQLLHNLRAAARPIELPQLLARVDLLTIDHALHGMTAEAWLRAGPTGRCTESLLMYGPFGVPCLSLRRDDAELLLTEWPLKLNAWDWIRL